MISDEFNSKVWVYFETNLKPRTRKEYWKIVNDFDKEVGHDPLTLTSKDAAKYYKYLINKMENNRISYSTGVMRLSVIRSVCNFNHRIRYYFKEDKVIQRRSSTIRYGTSCISYSNSWQRT